MAGRIWRAVGRQLWHRAELRIYCCPGATIDALPRPGRLRRDCPGDLKHYQRTDADQLSPDRYRAVAERRLEAGHHLFTLIENDLLIHYGWLADRQERAEDVVVGQVFFPLPESACLYDFYTHPSARNRGLYYQSLCQVLHDVRDRATAGRAYIYIYQHNRVSTHVALKAGFEYVGSLLKTRYFFVNRRVGVAASAGFRSLRLS
jgi:RimJ/RimL family protein N-acetyltransferase